MDEMESKTDTKENNQWVEDSVKNPLESNKPGTFKTPSFVISSKKRGQSNTDSTDLFKVTSVHKTFEKTADKLKLDKVEMVNFDRSITEGPVNLRDKGKTNDDIKQAELINKADNESEEKMVINESNDSKMNEEKLVKPSKSVIGLSPAEQLKLAQAPIPYKEPPWGGICDDKYSLEVIKNGAVVDTIELNSKSFHIVGRLPSCDISLEHPSLSRHHAVLQCANGQSQEFSRGWYLFDLDSTHGTWINKNKVPPKKYHRIHVDYVLKFGGSTRLFILQGPDSDRLDESELSATEMKEQREKQKKEAELLRLAEIEEAERKEEFLKRQEEARGCSWGINENDAEEEDTNEVNPFAAIEPENEDLYINDPKKSLNGYFEREGLELPEYQFTETGFGKWKCSIELPIDSSSGEPLTAEVVVSGKKKDAVVACALEACKILDRHGELRKAAQESRKKKERNWEDDDFYDSDEDVYLDRTGAIEKKREFRKMKVGKAEGSIETYDSLLDKHGCILAEIEEIEGKLEHARAQASSMQSEDVDALDAYMSAIKSGMMDTKTKIKLKRQLIDLKQEEQKIRNLVNIAKPAVLPEISLKNLKQDQAKPVFMLKVGKIKGPVAKKGSKKVLPDTKSSTGKDPLNKNNEEVEEDEEEEKLIERSVSANQQAVVTPKVLNTWAIEKTDLKRANETPVKIEPVESNPRVKGPTLPLAAVLQKLQNDAETSEKDNKTYDILEEHHTNPTSNEKRKGKSAASINKKQKADDSYGCADPDYAVWLPPTNQSGDGKTHLNEKLGY